MNNLQSKIKQAIDSVIKDRKVVAIAVGHLGSAPRILLVCKWIRRNLVYEHGQRR